MSIASEITRIKGAKASLKSSIEAKGISVPTNAKIDEYSDYVDDIETGEDISDYIGGTITSGGSTLGDGWSASIKKLPPLANTGTSCASLFYQFRGNEIDTSLLNTSNVTNMSNMFYNCSNLTSLNVSNWNTSNVTNMSNMFYNCSSLTSLNVSNWNTSNVTIMGSMFGGCTSLTSLNVSNWNTSDVTNMSNIFGGCTSLTSLNVSNWNTSDVTDMSGVFSACSNLTSLDVSNFNTSNVTNMQQMFYNCSNLTSLNLSSFTFKQNTAVNIYGMFFGCTKLTHLDIRGLDFTYITSYANMLLAVPRTCEIIVKDNDAKTWLNTKFPNYTNVKTVDEYEAE